MSATGESLYFKDDRVLYQETEGAKDAARGVISHEVEGGDTPRYVFDLWVCELVY